MDTKIATPLAASNQVHTEQANADLAQMRNRIAELESERIASCRRLDMLDAVLANTQDELQAKSEVAEHAVEKANEIQRWAKGLQADALQLRTERDKAQQRQDTAEAEVAKLSARISSADDETTAAKAALAAVIAQLEAARGTHAADTARVERFAAERDAARDVAAVLRGQLHAVKTQNAELLHTLRQRADA